MFLFILGFLIGYFMFHEDGRPLFYAGNDKTKYEKAYFGVLLG
jgi:hypothetical protein